MGNSPLERFVMNLKSTLNWNEKKQKIVRG